MSAGDAASFVGRRASIAALRATAADASAGAPRLVLVEGPPGVGKTALVSEFRRELTEGWRVVDVSGFETEALVPFGVATQLLSRLGGTAELDDHEDPVEAGRRLLDSLGSQGDRPLALLVDDAQWVDSPSLHALAFAFRRLEADRVLVLAASRPDAIDDTLQRLAGGPRGTRVVLEGFAAEEVEDLAAALGRAMSAGTARRLREHTAGLPIHLVALLRELDDDALSARGGALPAPRSFAMMVLHRVSSLPRDGEAIVAATAVLGDGCDLVDLAATAQVDDSVAALDTAVAAELLECRRDRDATRVGFTHALVRAAVLDGLAPSRRVELHRRAALQLHGTAALEHQAAAALIPDASLSAQLASSGHLAVERGSIDLGVHHLLEAARLCTDPTGAATLRVEALEALVWGGALSKANTLAGEIASDLAVADAARALYVRGYLALLNGSVGESKRLLLGAWDACDEQEDRDLRALIANRLAQLGTIFGMTERAGDAVMWSERSIELMPDVPGTPRAANGIILVSLVLAGRPGDARAAALDAHDTDASLAAGMFDDVLGRGIIELWTDRLDAARRDLALAATPTAHHAPYLATRLWALGFGADVEYRAGRWDDSISLAERAVSLAEDSEHLWLLGLLHGIAAMPLAGRGEWERAAMHVDAASSLASVLDSTVNVAYAATAAASLAAARGDDLRVVAATDVLAALDPERGAMEPGVLEWCALRVEALIALGRLDEAAVLVDRATRLADARCRTSARLAMARATGVVAAAHGNDEAAVTAFETGLALVTETSFPFSVARLRLAHGSYLRRRGRRRQAAEMLSAAFDSFAGLGAEPYRHRAETEMSACGLTPRRRTVELPELTPREHDIARLAADGLTNREIATQLVVSVKTVEYHLGNVFTKLGVRSRAQLAARSAQR